MKKIKFIWFFEFLRRMERSWTCGFTNPQTFARKLNITCTIRQRVWKRRKYVYSILQCTWSNTYKWWRRREKEKDGKEKTALRRFSAWHASHKDFLQMGNR